MVYAGYMVHKWANWPMPQASPPNNIPGVDAKFSFYVGAK